MWDGPQLISTLQSSTPHKIYINSSIFVDSDMYVTDTMCIVMACK